MSMSKFIMKAGKEEADEEGIIRRKVHACIVYLFQAV